MIEKWEPEDEQFWEKTGKKIANRTLWITTGALFLSFATWALWSTVIVKMKTVPGFDWITDDQKFLIVSMPGLVGATLRLPYSFIVQKFGTRKVVTFATASLLLPALSAVWLVQNPQPADKFWLLLVIAGFAGLGGGNFSAFMSSTSYFFPKKKAGTALGVQAGIGNFGVSASQLLVPLIMASGFAGGLVGASQTTKDGSSLWLQNAGMVWVIPIVFFTIAAWVWLRDIPVTGSISSQMVILKRKHNWIMTSIYFMTFGSFVGLAFAFPTLIGAQFTGAGAPKGLSYAWIGPLVGSAMRPIGGWVADKVGGAIVTHVCAIILLAASVTMALVIGKPATGSEGFTVFLILMLALFFAAGIGNGSTFRQIPIIFERKEAGPVLGWTAAIAAYGGFIVPVLFRWDIRNTFVVLAVFYAFNLVLNWWYYTRKNAEVHC